MGKKEFIVQYVAARIASFNSACEVAGLSTNTFYSSYEFTKEAMKKFVAEADYAFDLLLNAI